MAQARPGAVDGFQQEERACRWSPVWHRVAPVLSYPSRDPDLQTLPGLPVHQTESSSSGTRALRGPRDHQPGILFMVRLSPLPLASLLEGDAQRLHLQVDLPSQPWPPLSTPPPAAGVASESQNSSPARVPSAPHSPLPPPLLSVLLGCS